MFSFSLTIPLMVLLVASVTGRPVSETVNDVSNDDIKFFHIAEQFQYGIDALTLKPVEDRSVMELTFQNKKVVKNIGLIPDHVDYEEVEVMWNHTQVYNWTHVYNGTDYYQWDSTDDTQQQRMVGVFSDDYLWQRSQYQNPNVSVFRVTMSHIIGGLMSNHSAMKTSDEFQQQVDNMMHNLDKETGVADNNVYLRLTNLTSFGAVVPVNLYFGRQDTIDYAVDVVNTKLTIAQIQHYAKQAFDKTVLQTDVSLPAEWHQIVKNTRQQIGTPATSHKAWLDSATAETSDVVSIVPIDVSRNQPAKAAEYLAIGRNRYTKMNMFQGCMRPNARYYSGNANRQVFDACEEEPREYYFNGMAQHGVANTSFNNDPFIMDDSLCDYLSSTMQNSYTFNWDTSTFGPCDEQGQGRCVNYSKGYEPDGMHSSGIVHSCTNLFKNSGSLRFGGIFTESQPNAVTGDYTCPDTVEDGETWREGKLCLDYQCHHHLTFCASNYSNNKVNNTDTSLPKFGGIFGFLQEEKHGEKGQPPLYECPVGFAMIPLLVSGASNMVYYCLDFNSTFGVHRSPVFGMGNMTTERYDVMDTTGTNGFVVDPNSPESYMQQYADVFAPNTTTTAPSHRKPRSAKNTALIVALLLILLIVAGIAFFFYKKNYSPRSGYGRF